MTPHTEVASMPSASRIADSGRPSAVLDAEAFRGLHQAEAVAIWNYACYRLGPEEAEDAVADVFARAWAGRAGWRADRGTAGAWLWGIARNAITDSANRRRRRPPRSRTTCRTRRPAPGVSRARSSGRLAEGTVPPALATTLRQWPLVPGSAWTHRASGHDAGVQWTRGTFTETVDAAWRVRSGGMIVRLRRDFAPAQWPGAEPNKRRLDTQSMFWWSEAERDDAVLLYVAPGGVVEYHPGLDPAAAARRLAEPVGTGEDPARSAIRTFVRIPVRLDRGSGVDEARDGGEVAVPAGRFDGCTIFGYRISAVNTEYHWLCPGVGVVRRKSPRCGSIFGGFVVHVSWCAVPHQQRGPRP
jgi:DNA-directed RNA polymerase specialized sigma24 family protein